MENKDDTQKKADPMVPETPVHAFPTDLMTNLLFILKLKLFRKDLTLPVSPAYSEYTPEKKYENVTYKSEDIECDEEKLRNEYDRLSQEYARVVQRNLAAGWVWGPHGNIQITTGYAQLGSCSDWQLDIYRALCALPNIDCYQICKIRTAWHKAVVVYPKDAFWWRTSGSVFDPWFTGNSHVYTVPGWFVWCGLSWRQGCCK